MIRLKQPGRHSPAVGLPLVEAVWDFHEALHANSHFECLIFQIKVDFVVRDTTFFFSLHKNY